jgi:hypothetical protein
MLYSSLVRKHAKKYEKNAEQKKTELLHLSEEHNDGKHQIYE